MSSLWNEYDVSFYFSILIISSLVTSFRGISTWLEQWYLCQHIFGPRWNHNLYISTSLLQKMVGKMTKWFLLLFIFLWTNFSFGIFLYLVSTYAGQSSGVCLALTSDDGDINHWELQLWGFHCYLHFFPLSVNLKYWIDFISFEFFLMYCLSHL